LGATGGDRHHNQRARVAIRDWDTARDDWLVLGRTPLQDAPLPNGVARWRFEKDGYVPRELVAGLPDASREPIRLTTTAETPADMVLIPSGQVELVPGKPSKVGAFWIDRFEVTNRQFQQFVDAGGYEDRRYWNEELVKDGVVLSWDEAKKSFRDRTGRSGPATWTDGRYPSGGEDYPVQGISWHEASAFAAFAGKALPTVAHWMRAACIDQERYIIPLSNSLGSGPVPVGSHPGIGRFDVFDMVGNVREWCRNADERDERRMTMGGAWDEPGYTFRSPIANPPFTRSPKFGFRCMMSREDIPPELLARMSHVPRRYDLETRATLQQLEAYKHQFLYDRDAPLNAQLALRQEESESCLHEVVRIDAAYGQERFDLHIFLPRRARPPFRTLVFFPGAGSVTLSRLTRRVGSDVAWDFMDGILGFVERGWAVCWPIYWGTYERRSDGSWLQPSVVARDRYVQIAKDLSRSVDYLQSREDLDRNGLAYCGFSWGALLGPLMTVVEPRFRAAVLIAGGYRHAPHMPEIEPFQYAPYVQIPALMINGRNDSVFYHEWYQLPLYRDLGTEDKMLVVLDVGHLPRYEETVELAHRWLLRSLRHGNDGPRQSVMGPDLLATLGTINDLVVVYAGQGQKIEAQQIKQEFLKMRRPGGETAP
jgi:predicted esterase